MKKARGLLSGNLQPAYRRIPNPSLFHYSIFSESNEAVVDAIIMTKLPNNPKQGICKLCHSQGELRESHLIPKAAYRLIQRSENAPPVVIKPTVSMPTNEQVKDYVLCHTCEQLFSKNGEDWVLKHCFRNDAGFKLKDLIDAARPVMGNGLKVYSALTIPQIDIEKLVYFAASVIWRAAIHNWKSGKDSIRRLLLGKYADELRRYLLGEALFPMGAAIWVNIIPNPVLWIVTTPPAGEKFNSCWKYQFPFLGFVFTLFLGSQINSAIQRMCTLRSPENFVYISDDVCEEIIRGFGKLMSQSRPVGSLIKDKTPGTV